MITFPKTLVEFFADRAKSTLETELDSPSVATIQAMVILSSHEIGNGKEARGWLYSGITQTPYFCNRRSLFDSRIRIEASL